LPNEAKREAQEALFTAIKDQAETNMRAALRAPEKAHLLRELAEAYRLTAGGSVPATAARNGKPADDTARNGKPPEEGVRKRTPGS
jgi:hypothetical protein